VTDDLDHGTDIDAVRFVALSEGLRDAFRRLSSPSLQAQERSRWQRRLVGITEVAKRNLPEAQVQLARYDEDWRRRSGATG
jgi:uncharacterized NAD(P)/FAD-binding protein YdhS